jgi:hypothetical protein
VIWLDHHQVKVDHHQVIWRVTQWDHLQKEIWDHHQVKEDLLQVIWLDQDQTDKVDQDQTDQLSDLMENQWDLQWDLHLTQKVVLDQDQMDLLQAEKVQILYLVMPDQQVRATQWVHHQTRWDQMDQWDHLRVIWDQDQTDQVDRHQTRWVKCILIWTMQEHIMDQDLKDQMDLLQELIWMATVWLRLHHQTIHLMM